MSDMLEICRSFFEYLNRNGIRYCHWKSNLNLDNALSGKTDLDILVARSSQKDFNKAINVFGLKKILAPPGKQFPNLEDYLGFDQSTGKLIHLHVHYALILGEKFIKNHHLPLEETFFKHLILSDRGVWIPCPELELIVLVLRAHMKTGLVSLVKHQIKDFIGQSYLPFPDHINQEFLELLRRCDLEKARSIYLECGLPLPEELIFRFLGALGTGNLHARAVVCNKLRILYGLRGYQRQNFLLAYLKYCAHFLQGMPPLSYFSAPKKTIWGGGKVIALVGADGSGKSTLVKDLEAWLSWKVRVRRIYHGIPKSPFVQIGFWLVRQFEKLNFERLAREVNALIWVLIARKRYVDSVRAHRLAGKGEVVLSDRFPLTDFQSMANPMDGPRLSQSGSSHARKESCWYEKLVCPHRVLVLKATLEELRKRKTDLPLHDHELKAEAVNCIKERRGIAIIDANRSYADVLLQIKRSIWDELMHEADGRKSCR